MDLIFNKSNNLKHFFDQYIRSIKTQFKILHYLILKITKVKNIHIPLNNIRRNLFCTNKIWQINYLLKFLKTSQNKIYSLLKIQFWILKNNSARTQIYKILLLCKIKYNSLLPLLYDNDLDKKATTYFKKSLTF